MPRTRIKICGITRVDDARCAAREGADAIGLNFYPASPRAVTIEQALSISNALPPFVATVALFVNATPATVEEVIRRLRPSLLQFHGDEDAKYCAQFGVPFLKAIRVGNAMSGDDLLECEAQYPLARALLLDTLSAGVDRVYGGSGHAFDWNLIPLQMRSRIVLAGGLRPESVAEAVRRIRPWAVDVSSGVEQSKGVSDHAKIAKFIEEVRNADAG
jgi:phosphoribosylanthranilate isomerase